MKQLNLIRHLIGLFILLAFSRCQQKNSEAELTDINLLRGDITLCGNSDFGEVTFSSGCAEEVRETFNLAISLLHSFEYEEAEKAFVRVIDTDPECAMAYWGVAMSNFHELWLQAGTDYLIKGSQILAASNSIRKSEKEKDYIDAIAAFYDEWETLGHRERVVRFERKMKGVYEKYSDDKEASIFYALALTAAASPTDKTYSNQRKSVKILESVYPSQPNHPGIAHYIIHNYDYPELAELALPTARRYAEIAPASAHAQHMPSHIFTRLGLWNESVKSNLSSIAAALCYAESIDSSGHWDEELHGMDYLVYAYLQTGDNAKALEQYEYLKTFKKVFPVNFKIAYTAAAIPSRIALENKNWAEAAQLEMPALAIDWKKFPWQRSILHFARAMGAVRSGDITSAEKELSVLKVNKTELLESQEMYQANQVQIQMNIIQAWIAYAKGEKKQAIELMEEAANMEYNTSKHPVTPGEVLPAGELLGDLLLAFNNPTEALKVYESDLLQHPNRFNGIYGAAMAAKATGNHKKATAYFELLLAQSPHSERTEIKTAREHLKR